jgi:hypothetical protein
MDLKSIPVTLCTPLSPVLLAAVTHKDLHCLLRCSLDAGMSSKARMACNLLSDIIPTCKVSAGVAPPRAHASRKMDTDGFSTRSASLMSMGERHSDTAKSSRTPAA